jgi:glycosyltransferase involved in cell wall biosynthesis
MDILFIGGSDFMRPVNHRGHHIVSSLETVARRVDTIALRAFYTGPRPAGPLTRLRRGLTDFFRERVEVTERQIGTQLVIRKLPSRLDPYLQDVWAYLHLGRLEGRRYDLGVFGDPENVLLAWILKRRGVVDTLVYDDWDYYAGFDAPLLWRLPMMWREQLCISIADTVISVGNLLSERRIKQGARQSCVVPNGVNYQLFARGQQKRPHPPTLIYMGTLDDWSGLDVAIEGFVQVQAKLPMSRFLILGPDDTPYARSLKGRIAELGLTDHVLLLGYKPYHELPDFLAEADVGVALFVPDDRMKYAFHLKIVEYMAAGLAVIGTKIGETEWMLRRSDAGKVLDYSSEAFADTAIEILSDPAQLAQYGERGMEYAKQYDWQVLFPEFHKAIGLGDFRQEAEA